MLFYYLFWLSLHCHIIPFQVKALRVFACDMLNNASLESSQISWPSSILSSVKDDSDEIFQTLISHNANPYTYGYSSNSMLSMPVQTLSFYEINGTTIGVHNLNTDSQPSFYMSPFGLNMSDIIDVGQLSHSYVYQPLENLNYKKVNISAGLGKRWTIPDLSSYMIQGASLHIQVCWNKIALSVCVKF